MARPVWTGVMTLGPVTVLIQISRLSSQVRRE